jgi:putative transposase
MSQSLVKNLIHLVYSTKNHQPWIAKDDRDGLFAYQAGIFKEWDSPALIIGGVEDHVHSLFSLSKNHSLSKIVEEVKKGSSKVDEDQRPQESRLSVAGWVWCVLRKPIELGRGETIY